LFFFFQDEDGIRDRNVTGVQTCALPIFAAGLVDKIVLAAPSKAGKGVLISPTIFGNVMLGPTAVDIDDKGDTSTTEEGFEFLLQKGRAIMPALLNEEVTASYAGLQIGRAHV